MAESKVFLPGLLILDLVPAAHRVSGVSAEFHLSSGLVGHGTETIQASVEARDH
jgi:hypothetical protein